jgi:hypothetical protein
MTLKIDHPDKNDLERSEESTLEPYEMNRNKI